MCFILRNLFCIEFNINYVCNSQSGLVVYLVVCVVERVVLGKGVVRSLNSQVLLKGRVLQTSTVGRIDLAETLGEV